jgi:hypothetical protein
MPRHLPRWAHSFQVRDSYAERAAEPGPEDGNDCARGTWCARAERSLSEDGTTARTPAKTWQAFCSADRTIIGECLDAFPGLYRRLHGAIGDFLTAETLVRAPFGPSVPLRGDVDALMRAMVAVACSWHERVSAVASLAVPDTQASRAAELGMRAGQLLARSCPVLSAHLDVMLALEPGEMTRPASSAPLCPDATVTGSHRDSVTVLLSGADAGNEILRLDYMGRSALLETDPAPVRFLGVPCRECDRRQLRRHPPPQHDGDPEWWSVCQLCGDLMTFADYRVWTKRNADFYVARVSPAQVAARLAVA